MGGFIAAEVAIAHPQRVDKLVLVSAAGITAEHQRNERALALMRRFEAALAWASTHPKPNFLLRPRGRQALRLVFAHPEKLPGPLLFEQAKGSGKPGFIDALDALSAYPLRDRLERISVPTLIIWGEHDRLVPLRDADVFEELISDARRSSTRTRGTRPCSSARRASTGVRRGGSCEARRIPDAGEGRRDALAGHGADGGAGDQLRVLGHHAVAYARRRRLVGGDAARRSPRRRASTSRRRLSTSMVIVSPSWTAAIGPPRDGLGGDVAGHEAVGGAREAPVGEQRDRPRPAPRPTIAAVTASISRMPGPPAGPSLRMTTTSPALDLAWP